MRPRRRKERNEESILEVAAGAGGPWSPRSGQGQGILDSELICRPRRLWAEGQGEAHGHILTTPQVQDQTTLGVWPPSLDSIPFTPSTWVLSSAKLVLGSCPPADAECPHTALPTQTRLHPTCPARGSGGWE